MDFDELYTDYNRYVFESYTRLTDDLHEITTDYIIRESSFVLESLSRLSIVLEGEDVKPNKKGVVRKTVGTIMGMLESMIKKLVGMVTGKIKSIADRDSKFLSEFGPSIDKLSYDNMDVSIMPYWKTNMAKMMNLNNAFFNKVQQYNVKDGDFKKFAESNLKAFMKDDDLKSGLTALYRYGTVSTNSIKEVKLSGNSLHQQIKVMYKYCNDFNSEYKKLIESQSRTLKNVVKKTESQILAQPIKESFLEIEGIDFSCSDLCVCENFAPVCGALEYVSEATVGEKKKDETPSDANKKSKVVINDNQGTEKDENIATLNVGDTASLKEVSHYGQLSLTTLLTVSEEKYFAYMKILRGVDSINKKRAKKNK